MHIIQSAMLQWWFVEKPQKRENAAYTESQGQKVQPNTVTQAYLRFQYLNPMLTVLSTPITSFLATPLTCESGWVRGFVSY